MSNKQTSDDEWDKLTNDLIKYAENLQIDDENQAKTIKEPKKYTKISDLLLRKSENRIETVIKKKPEVTTTATCKNINQPKITKKKLETPLQPPKLIRQNGFYRS
jgi:hypothetical protein